MTDNVAMITGGGHGIGRAIALALAADGADIVIGDLDLPSAEVVAAQVRSPERKALAVGVDVSDSQQVNRMVGRAVDRFGRLDILVNNAAVLRSGPAAWTAEADWRLVLAINLTGQFLCS